MSRRNSIVIALAEKLKIIDGSAGYKTNLFNNSFAKLKFWDETNDFPSVFVVAGSEAREYHPSAFTWGYLGVSLKVYCKGEDSQQLLEDLLEDVENVVDANRALVYDAVNNYETTEILVTSITTDEGLLAPYAIGEINLQVRYQIM
jgi:hypothetical protein